MGNYTCSTTNCCTPNRSYFTKEEKIEMLKEYKDALEKETKGVQEKIESLSAAS